MTYVITAPCIADYSCVEICPVKCISPGPEEVGFEQAEQLYINPEVCIDCGACVEACPVLAIYKEDEVPQKWKHYTQINADYFTQDKAKEIEL